jgi:hypothetical protein
MNAKEANQKAEEIRKRWKKAQMHVTKISIQEAVLSGEKSVNCGDLEDEVVRLLTREGYKVTQNMFRGCPTGSYTISWEHAGEDK